MEGHGWFNGISYYVDLIFDSYGMDDGYDQPTAYIFLL